MQRIEFVEVINYFGNYKQVNENIYLWNGYTIEYYDNKNEYNSMGKPAMVSNNFYWGAYTTKEDLINILLSILNKQNDKNIVISNIYNSLYKNIRIDNREKFGISLTDDNIFKININKVIKEFDEKFNLFNYDINVSEDIVDNLELSFSDLNCKYMKAKNMINSNYIEVYEDGNTSQIILSYILNGVRTTIEHVVKNNEDMIILDNRRIVYTNDCNISLNDFILLYNKLMETVSISSELADILKYNGKERVICKG